MLRFFLQNIPKISSIFPTVLHNSHCWYVNSLSYIHWPFSGWVEIWLYHHKLLSSAEWIIIGGHENKQKLIRKLLWKSISLKGAPWTIAYFKALLWNMIYIWPNVMSRHYIHSSRKFLANVRRNLIIIVVNYGNLLLLSQTMFIF